VIQLTNTVNALSTYFRYVNLPSFDISCQLRMSGIVLTTRVILYSHITFCLPIVVARVSSTHQCTRIAYTTRRSTAIKHNNIMMMIIKKYLSRIKIQLSALNKIIQCIIVMHVLRIGTIGDFYIVLFNNYLLYSYNTFLVKITFFSKPIVLNFKLNLFKNTIRHLSHYF